MDKMDFSDPLHGVEPNEILAMVDENSDGSSEIMVKEESPVSYQFVQMGADTNRVQLQALPAATNVVGTSTSAATSTVQPAQCQYYVIGNLNNYTSSAPFKIAPKVAGQTNARSPAAIQIVQSQPVKKRDDRRRATHNEVERRRRDKINHWIMKLGSIIPANGLMPASGATDESGAECSNSTATSDIQSKGGILSKACEYIPMLQENIKNLTECLNETEQLSMENQKLREMNEQLQTENDTLKLLMKKHGLCSATTSTKSVQPSGPNEISS